MEHAHLSALKFHSLMPPVFAFVFALNVAVIGMPSGALALGFGTLALSSHLNQKLSANVALILSDADDINTVRVALASQREYRQLGLQWQPDLTRIKVILQAKHSGHPFIELRSVGTIHAPLLSILLKADKTGRGTYYKHFQILMDPVETLALQQPAVVPLQSTPVQSDSTQSNPDPLGSELSTGIQAPVTSDAGWARIWRYGPVRNGDSLSEIAYRLRRDKRFSNRQVMLSLYEKNPHSFVDGDINLLKRGAWLHVPHGDVVKQYASQASMLRLSQLLAHTNPPARTEPQPLLASTSAPELKAQPKTKSGPQHPAAPIGQALQELRYSGKISLIGATTAKLTNDLKTVKTGVNQKFDAIHAEMMAGKLQMADLGKTVSSLDQSVRVIKQDIHALKKDISIIKSRTKLPVSEAFSNLQLALFALLAAIFGALVAVAFRKKPANSPEPANLRTTTPKDAALENNPSEVTTQKKASYDHNASEKTQTKLMADEAIQLLNQAEQSLGKCDYEQAEKTLRQLDKLTPDSVRASVLKAQLFHETDRQAERNYLINSISEASDKQRWERFCKLLPSHVWNACFGGELADNKPQNNGKETDNAAS